MIIEDFLGSPERILLPEHAEVDALRCPGALEDSALLDVRISGVWPRAWLLFDCKGALDVRQGNTAVLVAHGLRTISWKSDGDPPGRLNRAVGIWQPTVGNSEWHLQVSLWRNVTLELTARSAEFYVGNVPGGDDPPPDFGTATDDEIRAGLADWSSEFEPEYATFVDTQRPD